MEMPSFTVLFAGLLFGTIGFAAFIYGKKSQNWKPMTTGVVLMAYPYFIENAWLVYAIGIALCVSLFVFRD
jgi:ABC-type xylose transport system permease subunit